MYEEADVRYWMYGKMINGKGKGKGKGSWGAGRK